MSAAQKFENNKEVATTELMTFLSSFSALIDRHIVMVRKTMLDTVDQAMKGVMDLNATADHKLKKADEVLVKVQQAGFVSKSAKEVDSSFQDPSLKIKDINEKLSKHMSSLGNLDENVRSLLFAIMGALSIDDVVRQRLEHVSASLVAIQQGVSKIVERSQKDEKISESFMKEVQHEMLRSMHKVYTMEEEKVIFRKIFGKIEGVN